MNLSFAVPTPLEYFASLVHSDAEFPLLEAAVSLAQDEYPDLDVQQVLGEVDQLLARPEPLLALAPMQDVTDLPFMRVIARRGAPDWPCRGGPRSGWPGRRPRARPWRWAGR